MVVNSLYYNSPQPFKAEKTSISISDEVLTAALQAIYARDFNPQSTIEPNLFTAISATLRSAISAPVPGDSSPGLDPILSALRHSADVFAAFKVHRAQNDMAARLLDSKGNLKPFEQWKAEVLPIASHQCGPWLETEYNTAVLRARQTAQWQQFLDEKDVLPNLKWLPSTSPNPGADHRLYWNTVLPIDHPFWDQHRPGDRWNCKCSLTSTDEPPTPVPSEEETPFPTVSPSGNTPHPGLAGNPAKTRALFSQDHPYFPKDCNHCAFYKPNVKSRLRSLFKAQVKDCYNCPYINGCIDRALGRHTEGYNMHEWKISYRSTKAEGYVITELQRLIEAEKSKQSIAIYKKELNMCKVAADNGYIVEHLHEKDREDGMTYDITLNHIPTDLKSTSGAGNISKYARHAYNEQGAKAILFELTIRNPKMNVALIEAKRKCPNMKVLYYYTDEGVIREINTGSR